MKKLLLSFIAFCCTMAVGAQQTDQISAILQVENQDPQVFYGASALSKALEAAPNSGGVITLTSGQFNAVDITKDVKIFGAGFETDVDNDVALTNINGSFSVNLPAEITGPHSISLEGVYVNGDISVKSAVDGFSLTKCSVSTLTFSAAATRCMVTQSYIRYAINGGFDLYVQNSYVRARSITVLNDESFILLNHCIITDGYNFDSARSRFNCKNCVINASYLTYQNNRTFNYCIIATNDSPGVGSANNWVNVGAGNVFEDATNFDYTSSRTFTLKDPENKYIGSDGKQVGVNGGDFPWNKIPSTPVVKNLNATVAGTNLNVEYEAEVR